MNELQLERLLDAVRRRLLARRLATLASRNLLIALALILPAAVLSAFRPGPHLQAAAGALCGLGLVLALVESAVRRPDRFDAALHIDRHFNFEERLSTLASVSPAEAPPGMRAALTHDTLVHARGILASVACPLSIPRSAPFTGAALFCAAALLFGAAQQGAAERQTLAHNELDPMTSGGSYIHIELPADLQKELNKLSDPAKDSLDETLSRLDELLGKFKTLQDVKRSVEGLGPGDVAAEDIKRMLTETPDARTRLKAALDRAAEELQSDEKLKKAVREAQEALAGGSDENVAEALERLIAELSAETARHHLDKLKVLKSRLSAAKEAAEDDGRGVTRTLGSDGGADGEPAVDVSLPLFPEDAALKAKAALRYERVPARYRWVVERYFRNAPGGRGRPIGPPTIRSSRRD